MLTSDDLQDKRLTGIPVLIKAYQLHRDNPDIVEVIITVIMELCEYGEYAGRKNISKQLLLQCAYKL